jgi:putative membrane protein
MMWPGQMGDNWWLWGAILMVLFWGSILALTFFVIRLILRSGNRDRQPGQPYLRNENALEILKERYARGDISREEYLSMRKDLEE